MISKVTHFLEFLGLPKKYYKEIFKKGFSFSSAKMIYTLSNYCSKFGSIIDVGANKGQFAIASALFFPDASIYSFEPLPATFSLLKENLGNYKNIKLFNLALGNSDGVVEFNQNDYSLASSVLSISEFQKSKIPMTSFTHKIEVPIKKMETVFSEIQLKSPVLLKLDVQGFEKEVLDGAGNTLKNVDYLIYETSFIQMYDGEPLFDEMHQFVKNLGFELLGPIGYLRLGDFRIPQMDMLYKRVN